MQMNYWPAFTTGLIECHEPIYWLLDMMREEGRKMAKAYGAQGFCTPHALNLWGRSISRARQPRWSGSLISAPWQAMDIMEQQRDPLPLTNRNNNNPGNLHAETQWRASRTGGLVKARYIPERGDPVWTNFDPQAGREQAGKSPALVLSPKIYNEKTGLAVMVPITSHVKGYPFEF